MSHGYGRVKSDPKKPRVRFANNVKGVVAPPASVQWGRDPAIGMHLNDQWGDCVWGGIANRLEIQTYYSTGHETVIPDSVVETGYETTGFNPAAGPPGSNPTDNGTQLIDGLKYAVSPGMDGVSITAYAEISVPGNVDQLKLAIAELGPVLLGMNMPASAEQQFQQGQPWTVVPGAEIVGGHCVLGVGYDATYLYIQTWNAIWPVAWSFVSEYFDEGWAIYSPTWATPEHVDTTMLMAEFRVVTAVAQARQHFLSRFLDWMRRGL